MNIKHSLLWMLGIVGSQMPHGIRTSIYNNGVSNGRTMSKNRTTPLLILNYHRVLPEENPFAIDAITTHDFEAQLRVLKKYFHILPLANAVESLKSDSLPPFAVCLTFDDGYKDNYDHAFPLLAAYDAPATIFITTDFIGTNQLLWHDQILSTFERTSLISFDFPGFDMNDIPLSSTQQRRAAAFQTLEKLKVYHPSERDSWINQIHAYLKVDKQSERIMLNWQEITEMASRGISFGAHTRSHPILSTLDDAALQKEIIDSKNILTDKLGTPVTTFAYPNGREGDFDQRAITTLQNSGFCCAVTTESGFNNADHSIYELYRMAPWETNPYRFYGRLLFNSFL